MSEEKTKAEIKATAAVSEAIKKAAQAQAKLMLVEMAAKKSRESAKRKIENRKKYLLGAWLMHEMKNSEFENDLKNSELFKRLDTFLSREADRALFGLPAAD